MKTKNWTFFRYNGYRKKEMFTAGIFVLSMNNVSRKKIPRVLDKYGNILVFLVIKTF